MTTASLDQAKHPELAEYDRIVGVAGLRALQKFGCEPLDREVAAAHEAGHAVVALALGHVRRVARIQVKRAARSDVPVAERHREAWVGSIDLPEDEVAAYRAAAAAGGAWQLAREVAFVLAGITGEAVVGRAHPSSSVEDRVRAQFISQVAAAVELRADPPSMWAYDDQFEAWELEHRDALWELDGRIYAAAVGAAWDAIRRNRSAFDRLRLRLMTHERLGWPEIAPLVDDIQVERLPGDRP